MSTRNLNRLFAPRTVALVGASPRDGSLGKAVLRNLIEQTPQFDLYLVNPKHRSIDGRACYKSLQDLPATPDVVIITAPRGAVMAIAEEAAAYGAGAAIVVTADPSHGDESLKAQLRQLSQRSGLRIIGPNCLGVMAPHGKFNASFASHPIVPGGIAVVSQSGAITIALLAFAARRGIGFSGVVSLGDMADVGFAEMLDHFALDGNTRAILLYVEAITNAKDFMQAARAAARVKPVIAIKAGRSAAAAQAAATHTGALAGADDVYDAAFLRASILRVEGIAELFDAATALSRIRPFEGERLAIVTNGGGLGVLAIDELHQAGGLAAQLSAQTIQQLDAVLPAGWSRANPVDIVGDADPARFRAALIPVLDDPQVDAVSLMFCPTAMSQSHAVADVVVQCVREVRSRTSRNKPVFASWLEEDSEVEALFAAEGIPLFRTGAIEAFMNMVRWRRRRTTLMITPPAVAEKSVPQTDRARKILDAALARSETWLPPWDVTSILECYSIPCAQTFFASSPQETAAISQTLLAQSGACALKILSKDIVHKSDLGGVVLDLSTPAQVESAATLMLSRISAARPDARIDGFIVQAMVKFPHGRELIAGIAEDAVFGPFIVFGQGGKSVEIVRDRAIEFPPLDMALAHAMIARTRVSRLLKAYRDEPAACVESVAMTLAKLAQMSAELPQIISLDLNPLVAHEKGVMAIDARIAIAPTGATHTLRANPRLAIAPYPAWLEKRITLRSGAQLFLRPVRPQDESLYRAFLEKVSPEDLQLRFFSAVRQFDHAFIARLTQIDYARAYAVVAIDTASGDIVGTVRLLHDPAGVSAEYAILVRSDWQGMGLGWALMQEAIAYARSAGLKRIEGQILGSNIKMQHMCAELGFDLHRDPQDSATWLASLEISP